MPPKNFGKVMGEARHAYLHLGLPLGVFPEFVKEIHRVLQEVIDLGTEGAPGSARVEYLFVAGEGDLCVRLELPNYREMAHIQTAFNFGRPANAVLGRERSASWKFSVPVEIDRPSVAPLKGPTLRFVTHLRIRRELYVAGGTRAEAAVLDGILGTAAEFSDVLRADLEIGLGWADFLVNGETTTTGPAFYRFLKGLRELRTHDDYPVFQKTVTVLGLACDETGRIREPRFPVERALCLVRSQAGYFDQAHEALRELAAFEAGQTSPICVLDGRNDLCLLPDGRASGNGAFLERLHGLATRVGERPLSDAIERMQTHLLVVDPSAPMGLAPTLTRVELEGAPLELLEGRRRREDTELGKLLAKFSAKVDALRADDILDKRLVLGISTALSALRRAVADDLNHYDTRLAILSVLQGGRSLLGKIDDFHRAHEDVKQSASGDPVLLDTLRRRWASSLAQARNDLLEWCHLSERVLGERLAGSYDDFFGEGGSSISPRGGLQKVNFLADAIMQAYVHLLPASYVGRSSSQARYFAAVFESISRIGSIPGVGLISLPIKFRFALPRATPHILHEVSMLLCYQRYPSPVSPSTSTLGADERARGQILEDRSRNLAQLREEAWAEREEDFRNFIESQKLGSGFEDWRSRYLQQPALADSSSFAREDLQQVDQIKLFEEVAESVSDTLVCTYGFGGLPRFEFFLQDLTISFIERARETGATYGSGPGDLYKLLLFRLLVVWETLSWLEPNRPGKTKAMREQALFEIAALVDRVLQAPKYRDAAKAPPFAVFSTLGRRAQREAVQPALRKISSATYQVYFEPFLEDLQASIEDDAGRLKIEQIYDSPDFRGWNEQMAAGVVVQLPHTSEIVPCYLELLRIEQSAWLNGEVSSHAYDPQARHRAALARSAVLASFVQSGKGSVGGSA